MLIFKKSIGWCDVGVVGTKITDIDNESIRIFKEQAIANVFYKAGFIEGWGRGFEKILERTINRHVKNIKGLKYIGSGYSGHWEILKGTSVGYYKNRKRLYRPQME